MELIDPLSDPDAVRREVLALEHERLAAELAGVVRALFGVGLLLQAAASEVDDERVRHRLDAAIGGLDDAVRDLRERLFRA